MMNAKLNLKTSKVDFMSAPFWATGTRTPVTVMLVFLSLNNPPTSVGGISTFCAKPFCAKTFWIL
jgi:hypothetical protein